MHPRCKHSSEVIKVAQAISSESRQEAQRIINETYRESPSFWPYGFNIDGFDGGLYLLRSKEAGTAIGVVGWQERNEFDANGHDMVKVGYYTIAILPEHRRMGYAKEAVARIIHLKSAGVDKVRALVMAHNRPSLGLAGTLGVETLVKMAASLRQRG